MKRAFWAALLLFAAWFGLRSWEWGMMNDPFFRIKLMEHVSKYGVALGVWRDFVYLLELDIHDWGFFRYSYAAYAAVAYLFPPNLVYLSRLLELYFLLWVSWGMVKRAAGGERGASRIAAFGLAGVAAIRCLYDGVSILSLCEFSGDLFAAGAMAILLRERKTRWDFPWILLCLLVMVGFKPPFVWTLFAYGFYLIDRKRWAQAGLTLSLSAALLGIAIVLSRQGAYAQSIYKFEAGRFLSTVLRAGMHLAPSALVFALLFVAFRVDRARLARLLRERPDSVWAGAILLLGGLGYLATLLPRGVAQGLGVYLPAPLYLVVEGAFLFVAPVLVAREAGAARSARAALTLAAVIALAIGTFAMSRTVRRDQTVSEVRDWLIAVPGEGKAFAINSTELEFNIPAVIAFRLGHPWPHTMKSVTTGDPAPAKLDYYVVFQDEPPPRADAEGELVAKFPLAAIYSSPAKR